MTTFQVDDMSCGHCVASITQALQQLDPAAAVRVDLASHRVEVDQTPLPAAALAAAISAAGFTPVECLPAAGAAAPARSTAAGCGGACSCG